MINDWDITSCAKCHFVRQYVPQYVRDFPNPRAAYATKNGKDLRNKDDLHIAEMHMALDIFSFAVFFLLWPIFILGNVIV